MAVIIKPMETEAEIRGKAYVHWRAWHEAYAGIVDQGYLDRMTLEKCERAAFKWPDNILVAKDGERVVGFVGFDDVPLVSALGEDGIVRGADARVHPRLPDPGPFPARRRLRQAAVLRHSGGSPVVFV